MKGFILRHCRLSIILVYNIVTTAVVSLFYPLLPILMGYPPNFRQISAVPGITYTSQYIFVIAITLSIGTVILSAALKGLDRWYLYKTTDDASKEQLRMIRKKCINLPYRIYVFQVVILNASAALVLTLVGILYKGQAIMVIRILTLVFSMISLMAIISLVFSRRIFSTILLKTYIGERFDGVRVSLRKKIFLQILPVFVVAILFTGMLGYSRLIEEKGDLVGLVCSDMLANNSRIAQAASVDQLFWSFDKVDINGVKISYFAIINGRFFSSVDLQPDTVFSFYLDHPVNGRVYGDTNEVQGLIRHMNTKMGDIDLGIIYQLSSPRTIIYFVIALLSLLLLFTFIVAYSARSIMGDVSSVAESLGEIAEEKEVNSSKVIPVTSNDELGDLVYSFNRIRERQNDYDKLKNEFIANVSHELRTPLNVIFGTLQLFEVYLREDLDQNRDNVEKHTKIMKQNCQRLLRMINNMIDITRIEAGFFSVSFQQVEAVNYIELITRSVMEYAENKGLELHFSKAVQEEHIYCDIDKIERIMLNLLSNAIKFTKPGGSINVTVSENDGYMEISIKDTGIGIPKEKQGLIFERFRQVEQSLSRNFDGSGIGLSLVRSLVAMHRGRVTVVSEEGKGSEFIVMLPLNLEAGAASPFQLPDCCDDGDRFSERVKIELSDIYDMKIL